MAMFKSAKLNTDIDLSCTMLENGTFVIESWGLQRFFEEDENIRTLEAKIKVTPLFTGPDNVAFLACLTDNSGYYNETVGEANPKNLIGAISKSFPYTMALKRAKDRAIIEYLGLNDGNGKRAYSDNEIIEGGISPENASIYFGATESDVDGAVLTEATPKTEEEKHLAELYSYEIKTGPKKGITLEKLFCNQNYINWLLKQESFKNEELNLIKAMIEEIIELKGGIK